LNLNSNNNINNNPLKKNILKPNVKIKIVKKDSHSQLNDKNIQFGNNNYNYNFQNNNYNNNNLFSNFISNNNNANNNINGPNIYTIGNYKNDKSYSYSKLDSVQNTSFKNFDSPVKINRIKENVDKVPQNQKNRSIFERAAISPEIKRKKFDLEVPEFKLDFKSKLYKINIFKNNFNNFNIFNISNSIMSEF